MTTPAAAATTAEAAVPEVPDVPDVPDVPATTVTGPVEVVRHEQRLRVSVERAVSERVRFSRRVVTETRMVPVEVRREVLEVERVPVGPGEAADDPNRDAELPLEIVLHEEVPVVTVRVRPVERVVVGVTTATGEETVGAELATEQVEVTTDPAPDAAPPG